MNTALRSAAVLSILALLACRAPADQVALARSGGTVVGSVQVKLQREPGAGAGGNLVRRDLRYAFDIAHVRQPWNIPVSRVETTGRAKPFALSLLPGRNRIESLEVTFLEGGGAWFMSLFSPLDGRSVPIGLEFEADPSRVTYIGRVLVVLPLDLGAFDGPLRVSVEDYRESDVAAFDALLSGSRVPIETRLARPSR